MSGLRYGRIVSGLQVVGGLLVFFLLLRPDWLPRWVYWGVLALGAACGWVNTSCRKDYGGNDRVVLLQKPEKSC